MAARSAEDEIEALEESRRWLEAALSGDENWRALKSDTDGGNPTDDAARRTRDMRLEMALADNALFQAWRQVNNTLEALRTRSMTTDPIADPESSLPESPLELPAEIAALLRITASGSLPQQGQNGDMPSASMAAAIPSVAADVEARTRLVARLERMDDRKEVPPNLEARPTSARAPLNGGAPSRPLRSTHLRQQSRSSFGMGLACRRLRQGALPDPDAQRGLAPFERPIGRKASIDQVSHSSTSDEEAQVTIISAEGLRLQRESENRAGIVRRFRKALSGD